MVNPSMLMNIYDTTIIKNTCFYDVYSRTHRGGVLSFCLDHSTLELESWINNDRSKTEYSGFYMEYVKKNGLICLYGDDTMFEETPEITVCLSPEILRSLFAQFKKLIAEKTPAITLHWENDTPVLTPWHDVDLSWGIDTLKDSDKK